MSAADIVVLVHPRRQLDEVTASAERAGYRLVVVPRADETWDVGAPSTVVGVEPWDGDADDPRLADHLVGIVRKYDARGLVGVYEASLPAVSAAAEACGLPALSPSTTARLRDKSATRAALRAAGLPTPGFVSGPAGTALLEEARALRPPLVVKPSNGFASAGVQRVDTHEALEAACEHALAALRNMGLQTHEVVIEEYVDGPEYAVEAIAFDGQVHVLCVGYKGQPEGPYFEESVYQVPSGLPEDLEAVVREHVARAHAALGVDGGPTHTEVRIPANGTPYIIEMGGRVGGSGVSHNIVRGSTGVDFFAEVLAVAAGRRPSVADVPEPAYTGAAGNYIVPCGGSGVIEDISGLSGIAGDPRVTSVVQMMFPGDEVRPYPDFSGYPAFILSVHEDHADLLRFHDRLEADVAVVYQ